MPSHLPSPPARLPTLTVRNDSRAGTPNIPALYAARAGYEIVGEIGVPAIREKSLRLTRKIIDHATRAGYPVNTPRTTASAAAP